MPETRSESTRLSDGHMFYSSPKPAAAGHGSHDGRGFDAATTVRRADARGVAPGDRELGVQCL